jgi:hypothetical protein
VTTSAIAAGAAGPKVWQELPIAGSITVEQGQRYAALADVTRNASLSSIVSYLGGHGWAVTYAWEEGQPSRGLYAVDAWLAGLSPDTTDNHRWVWIEANRTGQTTAVSAASSWPLTVYALGKAFEAVAAPPGAAPSLGTAQTPAAASAGGAVWVLGGAAVLALLYYLL